MKSTPGQFAHNPTCRQSNIKCCGQTFIISLINVISAMGQHHHCDTNTITIIIITILFKNIGIFGTMMILTGRRGYTGQAARWGGRPVDQLIFTSWVGIVGSVRYQLKLSDDQITWVGIVGGFKLHLALVNQKSESTKQLVRIIF